MSAPSPHDSELNTWSEVATYLGVSVRQAQYEEKRGKLPIHRANGKRGRVVAYTDELDTWKRNRFQNPIQDENTGAEAADFKAPSAMSVPLALVRQPRFWICSSAILALAMAFVIVKTAGAGPAPAIFSIQDAVLRVSSSEGQLLWMYTFPNLLDAPAYQSATVYGMNRCLFGDLDNDGTMETVFVAVQSDVGANGSKVVCFSKNGLPKWEFSPRGAVYTRSGEFSPPYYVSTVHILPSLRVPLPGRLVVSSNHNLHHPNQVALLDSKGRIVAEYWHSGHLTTMTSWQRPEKENETEIILGGVNKGRSAATVVVLNPRAMSGASHESQATQITGVPVDVEKAVVIFPRSCLSKDSDFDRVTELRAVADRVVVGVTVGVDPSNTPGKIIYEFDKNWHVISATSTAGLKENHRRAERSGVLDHRWTQEEDDAFRAQVKVTVR